MQCSHICFFNMNAFVNFRIASAFTHRHRRYCMDYCCSMAMQQPIQLNLKMAQYPFAIPTLTPASKREQTHTEHSTFFFPLIYLQFRTHTKPLVSPFDSRIDRKWLAISGCSQFIKLQTNLTSLLFVVIFMCFSFQWITIISIQSALLNFNFIFVMATWISWEKNFEMNSIFVLWILIEQRHSHKKKTLSVEQINWIEFV